MNWYLFEHVNGKFEKEKHALIVATIPNLVSIYLYFESVDSPNSVLTSIQQSTRSILFQT